MIVAKIDDLVGEDFCAKEHKLAILAYPLMHGKECNGQWVQIRKNNAISTDGDLRYSVDFVITVDGAVAGYIDTEEKQQWTNGCWPYSFVNIAKHPMAHWRQGKFGTRLTNKLQSFAEKPKTSFWVGVRTDWQCAMVVNAETIFSCADDYVQQTRYSSIGLPVFQLDKEHGNVVSTPEDFCKLILEKIGGVNDSN